MGLLVCFPTRMVTGLSVNSHNHSMICIFLAPAGSPFMVIGLVLLVHSGRLSVESGISTHCRDTVEIDAELIC